MTDLFDQFLLSFMSCRNPEAEGQAMPHFVVVAQSCLTRDPMNCATPGFPVLHCLPEFAQIQVLGISDGI